MIRQAVAAISVLSASAAWAEVEQGPKNVPEFEPAFENQTRAPEIEDGTELVAELVAGGLANPWGIAVLPEGGYLVTERVGRLVHIAQDGTAAQIEGVPEVFARDQGGLLDVALAVDFAETRRIYLTYSKPHWLSGASTAAASAVLDLENARLDDVDEIFVQKPVVKGGAHFGSRVVPDGDYLYITASDRTRSESAQDLGTTQGKVVRITVDGDIPEDNPFVGTRGAEDAIWSYGHRNMQGAAINPATGELWTLEHGPAGGDELNRIEPGANYGWPVVSYGKRYNGEPVGEGITSAEGMVQPRYYWDPVIAPGGFVFYDGDMFEGWQGDVVAASLNPGSIVRLKLDGETVTGEARYLSELGRVRDIDIDLDGALLVVTDDPNGGLYRVTPR